MYQLVGWVYLALFFYIWGLAIKEYLKSFNSFMTVVCNGGLLFRSKLMDWILYCYTSVFSLLNSTLVWFVLKKSNFVYLIEHFLLCVPGAPFYAVKLQKYFMHKRVNVSCCQKNNWWCKNWRKYSCSSTVKCFLHHPCFRHVIGFLYTKD